MNKTDGLSERLYALDIARSFAIVGMLFVHVIMILAPASIESSNFSASFDWFSGRPAAVFMVLAGIGVSLRCRNEGVSKQKTDIQYKLAKRGLFFIVAGFVNLIIWPGDILRVYGVAFLVASAIVAWKNRFIYFLAFSVIFIFLILNVFIDFEKNWDFTTLEYHNLWTLQGAFLNLFFNGFRAVFPWLSLFLLGVAIGRAKLNSRFICWRYWVAGLSITLIVEMLSYVLVKLSLPEVSVQEQEIVVALLGTHSLPPMPLFLFASGGFALTFIMSCMLFVKYIPRSIVVPFESTGKMAFTWYVTHVAIIILIAVLLYQTANIAVSSAIYIWLGLCVFILVVSTLTLKTFKRGPLESLLRRWG